MNAAVEQYRLAESYVNGLIMGPPSPPLGTPPEEIRARAVARLQRLRSFLAFLGNPQQQYETIHIAGTSGKGSTCTFAASILTELGFRTGLHVSPYLQAATEKLQIDGRLVSAARYGQLVSDMRGSVEQWVAKGNERPNYGEFWVAMTFRFFAEEKVDVAVIEVGAGGRFDVTNVIEPRVAAVTSIGYDHLTTLGSTLPEIAWHKAGIIKRGSVAVSAVEGDEAADVVAAECELLGVPLIRVGIGSSFEHVEVDGNGTSFVDIPSGHRMRVHLPGSFQAINAATALAIARAFAGEAANVTALATGLFNARFPGRIERMQDRPLVILDGAHNPEKVASLRDSVTLLFPNARRILVFGALESKSYREMFEILSPSFQEIIVTEPRVLAKPATSVNEYAQISAGTASVSIEPRPLKALEKALSIACDDDVVIVTGSLYLVGNVRERWYPLNAILEQSTSWPMSDAPEPGDDQPAAS